MINYDEYEEDLMSYLLKIGAIEVMGYDEASDQFTYNLTQKCKELVPELWEEHYKMVNEIAFRLWDKGIVEIAFDQEGVAMVYLKDIENAIKIKDSLIDEERFFIENLLYKYQEDNKQG